MVGPKVKALTPSAEDVMKELELLAKTCREQRIETVEIVLPAAGVVRLRIHELALKASGVSQSTQPTPRPSEPPADPKAIEKKLRFGSGSV